MARHVLLLTDRDWTHPQGGGTGTNLYGQVTRWMAWGHRVTVIAGDYPGAAAILAVAAILLLTMRVPGGTPLSDVSYAPQRT